MSESPRTGFLLGLPFHVVDMERAIARCVAIVDNKAPGYVVTANVDFVAQAQTDARLRRIVFDADLVVADGMPLIWLSRIFGPRLPERVAGSDMVFRLFQEAQKRGWRVYFLGSDRPTLERCKVILGEWYPGINICGHDSPPFGKVEDWPNAEIAERIRIAAPDILLVAVGCPKQEYWISDYGMRLGIPLSLGIGASLDFIAGKQIRAPRWMQKTGLEWLWRMLGDPKRLVKRYARDMVAMVQLGALQWRLTRRGGGRGAPMAAVDAAEAAVLRWPGSVELVNLEAVPVPEADAATVLLDLGGVEYMDSAGIGLLAQQARDARRRGAKFALVAASPVVRDILERMQLGALIPIKERAAVEVARKKVLVSAGMIQNGKSGVGRYVVEIVKRLAACPQIELYIAGLAADRGLLDCVDAAHWVEIPAGSAQGARNLIWHQTKLPGILRRQGIALLHIPSYRRIVWRSPVPQIATIHDCAPFRLRGKYGLSRGIFGRKVVPLLARRCEKILTVSGDSAADIERHLGVAKAKIQVIWNGIEHERYRPLGEAALAEIRERKKLGQRYFLYVSRLEHPAKNHVRLIAAYGQYRDAGGAAWPLVLAGADWHGAEQVHAAVAASRYAKDIRLLGFVAEADLPALYSAAGALIFPSLMEGFGLPVVEAQACGTRVATSEAGSLGEIAGAAALRFDPMDSAAIAAAMGQIAAESAEAAAARVELGLAHARGFSWDSVAQQTLAAYLEVLGRAEGN